MPAGFDISIGEKAGSDRLLLDPGGTRTQSVHTINAFPDVRLYAD